MKTRSNTILLLLSTAVFASNTFVFDSHRFAQYADVIDGPILDQHVQHTTRKKGKHIKEVPPINYRHFGPQTAQISSQVSMDISLAPIAKSNTVLVANLASEKPLNVLEAVESMLNERVGPGALFVIFPREIDAKKASTK